MEWDGFALRRVRRGDVEIVRRVTVAVRDLDWATIAPTISGLEIENQANSFSITFTATHDLGSAVFAWDGRVTGTENGTVTYEMLGSSETEFQYNRIGLVISHPANQAGFPYVARWHGANSSTGVLPDLIAPQLWIDGTVHGAITHFDEFDIDTGPSGVVRLSFSGDEFELEDQRNWADGSFKTYSTPLHLGWPHTASQGQELHQQVAIAVLLPSSDGTAQNAQSTADGSGVANEWVRGADFPFPALGVRDHGTRTDRLIGAELGVQYVRIDVDCAAAPFSMPEIPLLPEGVAIELALHVAADALDACREAIEHISPIAALARILVIVGGLGVPDRQVIESIAAMAPGVPVFASTMGNLAELNRRAPDLGAGAGVAVPFTPTFHDVDEQSILEGLEALDAVVRTASSISSGRVAIAAVSLRPYANLLARSWGEQNQTDNRIDSWFTASWFLAALARLAESGAESITAFSLSGVHGFLRDDGSRRPIASVISAVAGSAGLTTRRIRAASHSSVEGVEVLANDGTRVVLTNLSDETIRLPWSTPGYRQWSLSSTPQGQESGLAVLDGQIRLDAWDVVVLREAR